VCSLAAFSAVPVSQAGSLITSGGEGREGDVAQTGVGLGMGAVMGDGLEVSLGAILGMVW